MTSNNIPSSNKNKDLLNRLIILEKFIELKSNECAYYRTKVHLMQISSVNSEITKKNSCKNDKRSSSEDISQNSTTIPSQSHSIDDRHRRNSVPKSSQGKSILKKGISYSAIPFDQSTKFKQRYRKEIDNKIYAQNQNYYEDIPSRSNQKTSLPKDQNLLEQMLISYLNKHLPQSVAQDKNIQCNENDFHSIATPHTILKIRLPQRFVKSLLAQQKKSTTPKLKVHLSSELLSKLFQSIHTNSQTPNKNQFTIQSQFGKIAACINHENSIDNKQSKTIHAKAEVKIHHEDRLPIIRHIARTSSDGSDRRKILLEKNRHTNSHKHRRKQRHFHKSSSTSQEESKRSSLTNITQTIETFPSSNQTSNSIIVENTKNKRNKRNIKI